MSMFCFQCEQTSDATACTSLGICGKDETTAALQDLLIHATRGIAMYAHRARELDARDKDVDVFVLEALFATVTNVDFDPDRLEEALRAAGDVLARARSLYEGACAAAGKTPETLGGPAAWVPAPDLDGLVAQGREQSIPARREALGRDIADLMELQLYGQKGAAAYAKHAQVLGREAEDVYAGLHEGLDLQTQTDVSVDTMLGACLKVGEINLKTMEILDTAHTGTYGHPEPTPVRITPVKGKAILVSGHDLKDLKELLEQTEGKGINIYTHSEMLPAHAYPELKKYDHLVGNYGGAWQNQRKEFDEFPGAVLMTTNCIRKPKPSYKERIFTTGLVAWPGVTHVENGEFGPVIEAALAQPGFAEDGEDKTILTGFGHNAVMGVAGTVIDAVKQGAVKHFFLVGGCDGVESERGYYTEFAEQVPDDCVILTLACGKFRFNKLEFGDIGGIPRLLDIGQCNDAYSAIQIAVALANAFECGVNDLPLSMVLSWFEQKAVAILLTLLHLGITNIRLGPTLPAFVTPNVLNVLVEKFGIAPTTTPEADLATLMG